MGQMARSGEQKSRRSRNFVRIGEFSLTRVQLSSAYRDPMKIFHVACLILATGVALAEPPVPPAPAPAESAPMAKKDRRPDDRRPEDKDKDRDKDRDKDKRPPEDRPGAGMFKRADTDNDGFISLAEFSALERIAKLPEEKRIEIFKRFDKDGDGKVSAEEMQPFHRGGMPPMKDMDLNKDGRITFDEFEKAPFIAKLPEERRRAVFDRMDTDKDGALTPKDRPQRRPPGPGEGRGDGGGRRGGRGNPLDMIRDLDKNGDGALSFEEFRQAPFLKDRDEDFQEARFNEMDRNKDLKIDASDFPPPEERKSPEGEAPEGAPAPPPPGAPPPPPPAPKAEK